MPTFFNRILMGGFSVEHKTFLELAVETFEKGDVDLGAKYLLKAYYGSDKSKEILGYFDEIFFKPNLEELERIYNLNSEKIKNELKKETLEFKDLAYYVIPIEEDCFYIYDKKNQDIISDEFDKEQIVVIKLCTVESLDILKDKDINEHFKLEKVAASNSKYYVKNSELLSKYPYIFRKDFREVDNNSFEDDMNGHKKTFFHDLSKPLFIENEYNESNLKYLYDNVRNSEDFGEDNHVYLYYDSFDKFCYYMNYIDFESLLESEKFIFLFEAEKSNYPIDFKTRFSLEYNKKNVKKMSLEDVDRLTYIIGYMHGGTGYITSVLNENENVFFINLFALNKAMDDNARQFYYTMIMNNEEYIKSNDFIEFACRYQGYMGIFDISYTELNNRKKIDNPKNFISNIKRLCGDREFIKGTEAFKIMLLSILYERKPNYNPRVKPVFLFDAHVWRTNVYVNLLQQFKELKLLSPFRNPLALIASVYRAGLMNAENQIIPCLTSLYEHYDFLQEHYLDKLSVVKFEDAKLNPKTIFKLLCEYLDVPYSNKMFKEAKYEHEVTGRVNSRFNLEALNKDVSDVLSEFDQFRLKLFYAPILKTYGYDYFDNEKYQLKESTILDLLDKEFKFESLDNMKFVVDKSFNLVDKNEVRKWIKDNLIRVYHKQQKGEIFYPPLIGLGDNQNG